MFDSFFEIEISAIASFLDLFLKFGATFSGRPDYHRALFLELHANLKEYLATDQVRRPRRYILWPTSNGF